MFGKKYNGKSFSGKGVLNEKIRVSFGLPLFLGQLIDKIPVPFFLKNFRFPAIRIPDFHEFLAFIVSLDPRRHRRAYTVVGAILLILFSIMLVSDFMKVRALEHYNPDTTTRIFDKNKVLISELFREKREVVSYKRIPKNLVNAFIAMEDNDFYEHFGVNPKGIVRAFFVNIASASVKQGGSTITQQLAKVLMTNQKRNFMRKFKEFFLALMIEACYSKEKIMEMYLNQIFLGHGAYGVEAASNIYFGKHVWELNLAECSLLATLPSSPNRLSPIKNPERSMVMHRIALAKMADMGFIKVQDGEQAYLNFWPDYMVYLSNLPPTMSVYSARIDHAPWFTEYIRRKLVNEYGEEMVYQKGLLVYTTLDLTKQLAAQNVMKSALGQQNSVSSRLIFKKEDVITEEYGAEVELLSILFGLNPMDRKGSVQLKRVNDRFQEDALDELEIVDLLAGGDLIGGFCNDYKYMYFQDKEFVKVEGALISVNQSNGYIEAMIGGSNFETMNQLNRSVQSYRQAGSSIKPLLYSAAFESRKFTPATAFLDSPALYLDSEGGDWIPKNYEGGYYGMMRLRKALALSINVISVKLAESIGIDMTMDYYARFFSMDKAEAKRRIQRDFSIALGSLDVSPLEMACAYGAIANGGHEVIPQSIRYVTTRDGKMLDNFEEKVKAMPHAQIIKPETSQIMISMLQTVINGGTGAGANPGRPAGGKTGTTSGWRDAWFVGFTPDISTAIWFGYDTQGMSLGEGQTGGGIAAPTWGRYMREALQNTPVSNFPTFAGLSETEVCAFSGLLPSPSCPERIKEVFIPGTVPTEFCTKCAERNTDYNLSISGPKESIVEKNKDDINQGLKNLKGQQTLEKVGDDLLN